jgi:hypothetical protein
MSERPRRLRQLLLAMWLGARACVVYDEAGTEVTLEVSPHAATMCNDDGRCADRLELSLTSVELLSCSAADVALIDVGRRARRALSSLISLPSARAAHIEGTPTRWADGTIVVHGTDAATTTLGVLQPPPDRYCGVHLVLADIEPEVAESEGLPALAGLVLRASGAGNDPWETSTTASTEATLELDTPLALEPGAAAMVRVSFVVEAPTLAAEAWATEEGARAWLLAIKSGLSVTVD